MVFNPNNYNINQTIMENIRLAIVEDDLVIRKNLSRFVQTNKSVSLEYCVNSVEELIQILDQTPDANLDVLLLDIGLPGMSGLEGIRPILNRQKELNIIMLTTYEEDEKIFKALCAGAVGYLSKRTPLTQIMDAVFVIHRGGSYMSPSIARKVVHYFKPQPKQNTTLTSRQLQIVQGVVDGLSFKMIADKYMISHETVRDHIKKIYRKLNINSKSELVKKSISGELD